MTQTMLRKPGPAPCLAAGLLAAYGVVLRHSIVLYSIV